MLLCPSRINIHFTPLPLISLHILNSLLFSLGAEGALERWFSMNQPRFLEKLDIPTTTTTTTVPSSSFKAPWLC
uniref:Uncharacterized protein n=1 Tax=Piliocolobus tephrosceles TaxID=591936 RepID=A0A8C9LU64_9PRIM